MRNFCALFYVPLLIQVVASQQCVDTTGAEYKDCPANGGGSSAIILTCCNDFTYNGPDSQSYVFPGGNFDLIIESHNLGVNEKLIIKRFDCDGDCKFLEIDSSVALPFYVHLENSKFIMATDAAVLTVKFSVDSMDRPYCDCHPCRRVYRRGDGSGEYDVRVNGNCYRIFCEFLSGGEGSVYISRYSLIMSPTPPIVKFFNRNNKAYLKFKKSSQQKTSVIEQLAAFDHNDLSFQISSHGGYQLLTNHIGTPYAYLGIVPLSQLSQGTVHGYKHNGLDYTFTNCDGNGNSYFAFDTRNLQGSEVSGASRPWIGSASVSPVTLPDYFFYYVEEHQGGCGVRYRTSWVALGYPFKY